jgi:hypothetical protein
VVPIRIAIAERLNSTPKRSFGAIGHDGKSCPKADTRVRQSGTTPSPRYHCVSASNIWSIFRLLLTIS